MFRSHFEPDVFNLSRFTRVNNSNGFMLKSGVGGIVVEYYVEGSRIIQQ